MGQKGPTAQQQKQQQDITSGQLDIEKDQQKNSDQLYKLTEPGLEATESFYKTLSTGDPTAIQRATAPATEQIAKGYQQSKENISKTMPRGGARDLALQEADISKSGAIGSTKANAYLSSFPALASLAGEGIGMSSTEISSALAAFSGASSSNQQAATMSGAGKAQTLGFIGGLAGDAAGATGMAMGCWIAEAIFGEKSIHTIRLRVFLNNVWGKTFTGSIVMALYRRHGRWVAEQVKQRSWVRKIMTPLFMYADKKAYEWELSWVPALRVLGVI